MKNEVEQLRNALRESAKDFVFLRQETEKEKAELFNLLRQSKSVIEALIADAKAVSATQITLPHEEKLLAEIEKTLAKYNGLEANHK